MFELNISVEFLSSCSEEEKMLYSSLYLIITTVSALIREQPLKDQSVLEVIVNGILLS